jgi:hypothetical protein
VKDVRERLKPSEHYPSVEQAKDEQEIRAQVLEHEQQEAQKRIDLGREQKLMRKLKQMARRADRLKDKRSREVRAKSDTLKSHYQDELDFRHRRYQQKMAKASKQRKARKPIGLIKHLRIAIGYETLLKWKYDHQDRQRKLTFEKEIAALKNAQAKELERLKRHEKRLQQQTVREAASLNRLAKKLRVRKEKLQQMLEKDRKLELQNLDRQMTLTL